MGPSAIAGGDSTGPVCASRRLAFSIAIAFVVLVSGTLRGPSIWWAAALQHGILAATALLLCVGVLKPGAGITRGEDRALVVTLGLLVGYLWWATSLAPMPRYTIAALLGISSTGGVAVAAWYLGRRNSAWREHIVTVLSMLGGLVALWSLVSWLGSGLERPLAPMGHHNLLGAFLGLVVPLQWVGARSIKGPVRWLLLGSMLLALLALVASQSLGSIAGVGVAALVMIGVDESRRATIFGIRQKLVPAGLALLVVGIACVLTPPGREIASRALSILSGGGDSSMAARIDYAGAAIGAVGSIHPWTGFGLGLTPFAFPLDRLQYLSVCECGLAVTHLHSLPIHVLYETGIVGLGLVVLLWGGVTRGLWRRLTSAEGETWIALGLFGAWTSYSVRCLTDVNSLAAGITLSASLVVGAGLSMPSRSEDGRTHPWTDRFLILLTSIPVLCALPAIFQVDRAHRSAEHARAIYETPKPTQEALETAFALYEAAEEADPGLGFYAHEAAQVAERLAVTARDAQWLDRADRLFERAIYAVPSVPGYASRLAKLRMDHGELEAALPPAYLAAALERSSPFVQVPLVRLLIQLGHTEDAEAILGWQIGRVPDMICYQSYAPDSLSGLRAAAVEIAHRDFPETAEALDRLHESCFSMERSFSMVPYSRVDDTEPNYQRSMYIFRRKSIPSRIGQIHVNRTLVLKKHETEWWTPAAVAQRAAPAVDSRTALLTTHAPGIGYFPAKFFAAD